MPSTRPPLITIVFAKVPPDIFNTLPVKIILFWLILKFNNFFNSIISLSELPNFVSIILSLRFSFLSLIFSFLRKAADWTSFITFSNSKAGLLTKLDIGDKKSVKKDDKFLIAIKSSLPTSIRIKQVTINNELKNLFLYNLLFSKSILNMF